MMPNKKPFQVISIYNGRIAKEKSGGEGKDI